MHDIEVAVKTMKEGTMCRRSAGKLFHTRGPVTEKLLSPKVLRVRGRKHVLSVAERRSKYRTLKKLLCSLLSLTNINNL